jgi:hypothetical protein
MARPNFVLSYHPDMPCICMWAWDLISHTVEHDGLTRCNHHAEHSTSSSQIKMHASDGHVVECGNKQTNMHLHRLSRLSNFLIQSTLRLGKIRSASVNLFAHRTSAAPYLPVPHKR